MARYVIFPGTAGSYVDTANVNLSDANVAHIYQAQPWVGWLNFTSIASYVETSAFADVGIELEANGSGPASCTHVNNLVAVTATSPYVASCFVKSKTGYEARMGIAWRNGGSGNGQSEGSWVDLSSDARIVADGFSAPAATDGAMAVPQFRKSGGLGAPDPGDKFNIYDPMIEAGTVSSPNFVPSLRIVSDLDLRAKVAATDWTSTEQELLVTQKAGSLGYRLTVSVTGALSMKVSLNGTSFGFSALSTVLGLVDGSEYQLRATRVAASGAWVMYQDGVNVASGTGSSGDVWPADVGLEVGSRLEGTQLFFTGGMYTAEVRDGIDGPIVAIFDAEDIGL